VWLKNTGFVNFPPELQIKKDVIDLNAEEHAKLK
jgi:hypothetical protein